MNQLVVLFAVVAVACGSVVLVQPAHHPALVLDPHGRPLDTAEVVAARAIHLQAKALEGHHAPLVAAPLWHGHSAIAAPWFGAHGHLLKKRSLGHLTYAAPIVHHAIAPSAVSHQSRVDVVSSPAVVSHAVAAPAVVAHAAPAVVAYTAPAAVSHQSRVDVHSAPAYAAHSVVAAPAYAAHSVVAAPAYAAHSVVAAPAYSAHSVLAAPAWGHSLYGAHAAHSAHGIWKRSLGHFAHVIAAPSAVSHQSRVDVVSSPAVVAHAAPVSYAHAAPLAYSHVAPLAVAHAVPAAVSHVSRVDVHSSPAVVAHAAVAPIAHSVQAPWAHYSHHGLHSSPLVHAW